VGYVEVEAKSVPCWVGNKGTGNDEEDEGIDF
jgi:hypothetical protein